MSVKETDREVTTVVHYRGTCDGCRKDYVEFTTDGDREDMFSGGYESERIVDALANEDWTVVGDITERDVKLLCPDCPPCEEVGHSWIPTVAGDRIGCRICGFEPHVPLTGGATAAGMAELRMTASV